MPTSGIVDQNWAGGASLPARPARWQVRGTTIQGEYRRQWVGALRSGKFTQYRGGALAYFPEGDGPEPTAHCCLGVGADVAGSYVERGTETLSSYPRAMRRLGLTSDVGWFQGQFDNQDLDRCLAVLNDTMGSDFGEIADLIEREPKGLFLLKAPSHRVYPC